MAKSFSLLTAFLIGHLATPAMASPPAKNQHTELYPLMYEMLSEISALQPYIASKQRFEAKPSQAEIEKRLKNLSRLSAKVLKQKSLQSASYRVSGEALNQQIQQSNAAFISGNKEYSRWALSSVPFACASCHTQGTADPKPLWSLKEEELSGSALERADFLFSTRNYEAAERIYTRVIRSFSNSPAPPATQVQDPGEVENALKSKIIIWIRVLRDLKGAKASLVEDLNNKNLPPDLRELMKHWTKQIDMVNSSASKDLALKGEDLLKVARQKLPGNSGTFMSGVHPELIQYLWISGLLYEQLNKSPKPSLIPEYLYWLGLVDFGLNSSFFYSLGATYLRDCIVSYPRTSITQKCYKEYEIQIAQLYTGTRGTDIPQDVQDDLKSLRAKAGIN